MTIFLRIGLFCFFCCGIVACNNNKTANTSANKVAADTTQFYPIANFIADEMKYVDLRNFTIVEKKFNLTVKDYDTLFEVSVKDYDYVDESIDFEIINIGKHDVNSLTIDLENQESLSFFPRFPQQFTKVLMWF
jgi:hypothetical protein